MIVQSVISSIAKSYEIIVEKVESDNAIVTSAKKYLYGLRRFGANSTATQSTIDTILTSLATSHYSNYFIAEILGVPNKRLTPKILVPSTDSHKNNNNFSVHSSYHFIPAALTISKMHLL